ncbi:hypothetical protein Tco_0872569 [Tanacetum coccineum]
MLVAGLILLKTSFSSLTHKVIFLLKTSILEWAVDKNGRPRIKGTSSSSGMSKMIKSIGKINLLILTSTFSAIPLGCLMVQLASSMVNLVQGVIISIENLHILCLSPVITAKVLQSIWKRDYYRQYAPVLCARYGVLIEAPWFLIVASVEAQISLIMFEFSSCLIADSTINLVSDSSRLGLRSGYEEFTLFRW